MGIPQIIFITMTGIGLLLIANKHGKPDEYNIWVSLVATGITMGLLYWGGFFN
jgi:hypothetical protein